MDVMIGWRLRQASAIPASGRRQTLRQQTSQYTRVAHFMGLRRAIIAGAGRKAANRSTSRSWGDYPGNISLVSEANAITAPLMRRTSIRIFPSRTVCTGGPITDGSGLSTSCHNVGKSMPAAWAARHLVKRSAVVVMKAGQKNPGYSLDYQAVKKRRRSIQETYVAVGAGP
jgi:hypothetical protein